MTTTTDLNDKANESLRDLLNSIRGDLAAGRVPPQADVEKAKQLVGRLQSTTALPPIAFFTAPSKT